MLNKVREFAILGFAAPLRPMGCGATHGRLPVGDFTPRVDHAVLPVRHAERVVGGAAGVAAWWVLFDVVHRRVFSPASLAGRLARFGGGERAGEELGEPGVGTSSEGGRGRDALGVGAAALPLPPLPMPSSLPLPRAEFAFLSSLGVSAGLGSSFLAGTALGGVGCAAVLGALRICGIV